MAEIVREGDVSIFVELSHTHKGPGTRKIGFYNPVLEMDRDLTVAFCMYVAKQGGITFLDGLAATGIRGIRIAKEIDGNVRVDINERNPQSYELVKQHIAQNCVDARAFNEHLCTLFQRQTYDYIDIDPYGSPVPFISCMFRAFKRKTHIAVTATDTATLCGVYPRTCLRKYQSFPLKGDASKEVGLRILVGYLVRQAASFGYAFTPLFAYGRNHFFRVYGVMNRSVKKAEQTLLHTGWVIWDNGWHTTPIEELTSKPIAGPLWTGTLHNIEVIQDVSSHISRSLYSQKNTELKLLANLAEETMLPPLYYESSRIAKQCGTFQPRMNDILAGLREKGYRAGKCHLVPDSFKTDAPFNVIQTLFFKSAQPF